MFNNEYISANLKKLFSSDADPVRNFVSKAIREDTIYHSFKSDLLLDSASYRVGGRSMRWLFALKIFSQEFSFREKILGGGFKFLNWYSYVFLKVKRLNDHPHNPFLHVLLYSGLIGLILYIFLIIKVFRFYINQFKEYSILSICFFITFFFTFFSGSTPFDPPMMGFFIMLPFIKQLYTRD
jgi:O-antigen ligase